MARYLAVGDIHGCLRALETLAAAVPFTAEDVVITLGDHIDRGPDSCAVLNWLIAYARAAQLVCLRGNHEVMMLRARESAVGLRDWLLNGGDVALGSYTPRGATIRVSDIPPVHWDFLNQTRRWFETDNHFFVHANAYSDCPLENQPDFMLFWEPFDDPPPHESGKIMVCGHTVQSSGRPRTIGHAVCIDTGVYGEGWLTCLDVATGRYWQANQEGESRCGWLEE